MKIFYINEATHPHSATALCETGIAGTSEDCPVSDDRFIALRLPVAFLLSIVCLAAPARADFKAGVDADNRTAIFTGPVVRVIEGDTFEVQHNHHPELIRLKGIDCPEKGQPYGLFAEHVASDLVFRKQVTLQTHGLDEYGSTIGDVILPDGMNLNQELVRRGLCWWYRPYAPGDTVLEGLKTEA